MSNPPERWGNRMFESHLEYEQIKKFDEELGLRELRAKVNGKAGIVITDGQPNSFSINADTNYGSTSIEITRKYLDSGILAQLMESSPWDNDHRWVATEAHRFITLVASAMSIGCKLPAKMKASIEKIMDPKFVDHVRKSGPSLSHPKYAIEQFEKAMQDYKEGEPYNWGNKSFMEASILSQMTQAASRMGMTHMTPPPSSSPQLKNLGPIKVLEIPVGRMTVPHMFGAPTDEELGVQPIFAAYVCASCGKEKGQGGKDLAVCNGCKDRKYCGKECQRKHWKMHKTICKIPKNQMDAFLNSIPLDTIKSG